LLKIVIASLVACSSASAPPSAIRLVEAAHPHLAVAVHARRQAVAAIGRMLQRQRVDQPLDDEEADGGDVDPMPAHVCLLARIATLATHGEVQQRLIGGRRWR
jgi:hypothetical protein